MVPPISLPPGQSCLWHNNSNDKNNNTNNTTNNKQTNNDNNHNNNNMNNINHSRRLGRMPRHTCLGSRLSAILAYHHYYQ